MKYIIALAALIFTVSASAQTFKWDKKGADAGAVKKVEPSTNSKAYSERQIGLAGEYSADAAGTQTIFGERYVPTLLTASHPTLPLGSLVKVTNLSNNKTVTVRVNDKVQTCKDCLITLSAAAAEELDMNLRGRVAVERTGFSNWNPTVSGKAQAPQPATYGTVQPARTPTPGNDGPISIKGETYGWDASPSDAPATRASETGIVKPTVYREPAASPPSAPATYGSAQPTIFDKEVAPIVASNEADFIEAGAQPVVAARPATAIPAQGQPNQVAPPAPTVPYFQDGRTVAAPSDFPVPQTAVIRAAPNKASMPAPVVASSNTSANVTNANASPSSSQSTGHVIQLAAYSNLDYAKARVAELSKTGVAGVFYRTFTKDDGSTIHRVYSGFYPTRLEAQKAEAFNRSNFQLTGVVTELK
ncbi:septal ring lytic transglycosylase RlpA family protein [Lewinella sp. 4G2]|uniref:septal ring lytic transglycosylase RlpA family protein n=1 Tax=Lewinella sp. 4G2 TaxID=1803372 RepID=UPI0007B4C725|nr:RlpA-like double-psi beta-barrel domain-containing protein [Lewinella sp. 4G2]OAV44985.1 hypothetical protein A3850_010985 [Lewinella sp. 4G2]